MTTPIIYSAVVAIWINQKIGADLLRGGRGGDNELSGSIVILFVLGFAYGGGIWTIIGMLIERVAEVVIRSSRR
jgi:hypothetical protein